MRARMQWRNLIAACATVAVFSFSLGEMFPLLALKMDKWGIGATMIGLNSAMAPIGILVAALFIPKLAHRFGSKRVTLVMVVLTSLIILAMGSALSLAVVEFIYVAKRVISPIYLADAIAELTLIGWWVVSIVIS